jgi:hypothetical protein
MGLLDFSQPLLGQTVSGLLAPPQQNWMDALRVISAGLRDAGAYIQHQPQAADNVAALARQHSASVLAGLPPMITAALLLHAAQQRRAPQPPNSTAPQPEQLPTVTTPP